MSPKLQLLSDIYLASTGGIAATAASGGGILNPDLVDVLTSWDLDPEILAGIALAAGLYVFGWWRLCRYKSGCTVLPAWRGWCFAAGLASIAVALLSPIEVFSELFFFVHMTQHLLLVVVAAPLLWLAAPLLPMMEALPEGLRLGLGRLLVSGSPLYRLFGVFAHPLLALALFTGALAVWHVPPFYDAAQGQTAVHHLEHLIFLGTALLFWWPVIHPAGGPRRLSYGASILYFVPVLLEGNLIGALLTFANHPIYATYQQVPRLWGISVVQDQQLGGLIMWVPGGLVYLIPIFVLLTLLLKQEGKAGEETASRG